MILADVNVLVYALNSGDPLHERCARWWKEALAGNEAVVLPWAVLTGVIRICTNRRIMPAALSIEHAVEIVDEWLSLPQVKVPNDPQAHWPRLRAYLLETGAAGNLTTDAHLAALAMGLGATLWSCDNDFARFDGLRYRNPLRHSL